jgi:predicted nucleic acid-binding protein
MYAFPDFRRGCPLDPGFRAEEEQQVAVEVAWLVALYQELPISRAVTDRARHVERELVRLGQDRGPAVSDLLIAAAAETHGAVVVHYDRDSTPSPRSRANQSNGSCWQDPCHTHLASALRG